MFSSDDLYDNLVNQNLAKEEKHFLRGKAAAYQEISDEYDQRIDLLERGFDRILRSLLETPQPPF